MIRLINVTKEGVSFMTTQNRNDIFKYDNIFPKRIVKLSGNIDNPETVVKHKALQITTDENEYITFANGAIGPKAEIILDFGKEIHGHLRVLTYTIDGKSPPNFQITYGESVSEAISSIGYKGATNDHATRDFSVILPQFSDMSFSDSGFRFVRIRLLDNNTKVRIKSIVAVSVYRDIPYLGTFNCSDELINQIYATCAYTCHLNMQSYIWDGIKRDRLVWVGDMHPEMLTVRTVFGCHPIIESSLNFARETTPLPEWMNGMPTYSLWWLCILYDWYFYSGNNEFLCENKNYAVDLIKIVCNLVNTDGSDNLPSYFLDWPCNNKPQGKSGSLALLAIALETSAKLAKLFEQNDLSAECTAARERLMKSTPDSYGAKQVTAMLSFADWINQTDAGEQVLLNGAQGWSTFMSYYLLKASSKYNIEKTLDTLKEYYGGMLKMGATTFWEDFDVSWMKNATAIDDIPTNDKSDVHADNGRFCYKGLRHSLCHGWSSAPSAFLAEEIMGIHILEPGCKKILIKPNLGYLNFVKGTYPTKYGTIELSITKTDNKISINYNAPKEIEIITES